MCVFIQYARVIVGCVRHCGIQHSTTQPSFAPHIHTYSHTLSGGIYGRKSIK